MVCGGESGNLVVVVVVIVTTMTMAVVMALTKNPLARSQYQHI